MGSDHTKILEGRRPKVAEGMTTLIHQRQKCDPGPGMFLILISVALFHLMTVNNGVVAADYYSNGELADILYLERLNAMQPQKRFYDEDYGEVISGPVEKRGGNDAINRIISRLRPTYSKRPRESKRGVDFGLARGFSGSQALKHSLGLLAAQHPGGPGRRKRTSPSAGPIEE